MGTIIISLICLGGVCFTAGYCLGDQRGRRIGYWARDDFMWWLKKEEKYN